jgi:hypothetical protein
MSSFTSSDYTEENHEVVECVLEENYPVCRSSTGQRIPSFTKRKMMHSRYKCGIFIRENLLVACPR